MSDYKTKDMNAKAVRLICLSECWSPGLGYFRVGEIISGDELVKKLKDSPNFKEITEEK